MCKDDDTETSSKVHIQDKGISPIMFIVFFPGVQASSHQILANHHALFRWCQNTWGPLSRYAHYTNPNLGWFLVGFSSMSRLLFELKLPQIYYNFIQIPLFPLTDQYQAPKKKAATITQVHPATFARGRDHGISPWKSGNSKSAPARPANQLTSKSGLF